jgi:hypothetical protein
MSDAGTIILIVGGAILVRYTFFRKKKKKQTYSKRDLDENWPRSTDGLLEKGYTHRWRYVGKSTHLPPDMYPNEYYKCDRCGARGIDRGEGITTGSICGDRR